ncbi:MAG: hypothetical protein HKN53_03775, partial [Maribacter sp.]|nr:hypothetical protein [Maribacter sp.]
MRTNLLNILLFLLVANMSIAQEVYQLDTNYPVHDLDDYLEVIEDGDHALSVEKVLYDSNLVFTPLDSFPSFLNVDPVYWAKFQITSDGALETWTLEFEDRLSENVRWVCSNGKVDVFAYANGKQLFHKKTGVDYAKSEREIKEKWILNRVYLNIPSD